MYDLRRGVRLWINYNSSCTVRIPREYLEPTMPRSVWRCLAIGKVNQRDFRSRAVAGYLDTDLGSETTKSHFGNRHICFGVPWWSNMSRAYCVVNSAVTCSYTVRPLLRPSAASHPCSLRALSIHYPQSGRNSSTLLRLTLMPFPAVCCSISGLGARHTWWLNDSSLIRPYTYRCYNISKIGIKQIPGLHLNPTDGSSCFRHPS
jgi:hypothetical protein